MKIAVIGTGYVGLVSGACLAKMGNDVLCIDIDEAKIKALKKGEIPIYEPGLKDIVLDGIKNQNLNFSTDLNLALNHASVIFIAVGTPMGADGQADLRFVLEVAKQIGQSIQKPLLVVDKSTVPVGTAKLVKSTIENEIKKRNLQINFDVVSNPEFLKEGSAVADFLKPDRIIIGSDNPNSLEIMRQIYSPFMFNHDKIIAMDTLSAEMTKYAANAMLATKISFMNEIAIICEKTGADIDMVRRGIGSDNRIGYSFIYAGCGYGGSCFPKDVEALIYTAKANQIDPLILQAVEQRNKNQKKLVFDKILAHFGNLKGLRFGIWGLTFKPNTDDMREAPSIEVINSLLKHGASIKAYDPKAKAVEIFGDKIEYANDKYEALQDSDALVLLTEWSEFRAPDFDKISKFLKQKVIFDGRNQYDKKEFKKLGFTYFGIGR